MTSNEFFRGLLAALAERNSNISANHADMHRAFYEVLQAARQPETNLHIEDAVDIDYDPLYGQSAWFDKALTRAQRDQIISFPNPSYDTLCIKYNDEARAAVLARVGNRDTLTQLADVFITHLETGQQHPDR